MGLFSKEVCVFCGNSVGMLSRKKLQDKNYICKDCEENTSAFMDVSKYGQEYLKNHMEYMKKQDELYKKEFETLPKEEIERYVSVETGIVFADSIGMLEILSPKAKKKNYKELFRYDQIESYEEYQEENMGDGAQNNKYKETGIKLVFSCQEGIESVGRSEGEIATAHPYVRELKIKLNRDTNDSRCVKPMNHLDRIFGKEETYKTVGQGIKESFFGTKTENRNNMETIQDVGNLANLFKAKMSGDQNAVDSAKDALKQSALTKMGRFTERCEMKYTELADDAEKRAWNN